MRIIRLQDASLISAVLGIAACVAVASSASADIRPPNAPGKAPAAEPRIMVQRAAYLSKSQLIIPRKFLPAEKVGDASSSNRTIVAGVALSAGFALCGLVFLRRRGLGRSTIVASVAVGGLLIGTACVVANAPAPAPPPPVTIVEGREVAVSIVDGGDTIILMLAGDVRTTQEELQWPKDMKLQIYREPSSPPKSAPETPVPAPK